MKYMTFSLLILITKFVAAQVTYTYDANGNRTARSIIVTNSQPVDSTANDSLAEWELRGYLALGTEKKESVGDYDISIYPNPTRGAFAVGIDNMPADLQRKMLLYDMQGREVFVKEDFDALTEIDLSTLQNGTYILKILLGKEQTSWKVVKE